MSKPTPPRDNGDADETVSLAPLTPEEALRALLAVKPPEDVSADDKSARDQDSREVEE